MKDDVQFDTLVATALGWIDRESDGLGAPLRPTTSFLRDPDHLDRARRLFTRDDNPTYLQPEALINRLEGGLGCLLFASGMAAITACFQRLGPGDHIILPACVYSGLRVWLDRNGRRWGLQLTYLPEYDAASITSALRPGETKLVWMETPSNPTWVVSDIAAVASIAHAAGALVAIDNTVSTPVLTRPIEHGADLVLHSCSKYMNGHGDVIAGAVVAAPGGEPVLTELKRLRNEYGAVLGTFESWLLLRGMRTLSLRVKTASASALQLATFLRQQTAVLEVLYPGLPSHPNHDIARRQMSNGFGGMLSFRMKGGESAAKAFARRLQVVRQAISFGSTETVIEQRAGMEGPESPTPRDLLRVSVGIEDPSDLIADFEQALRATELRDA
jgi:cystathionine gamma-synthase